jgi:hypothetical protein
MCVHVSVSVSVSVSMSVPLCLSSDFVALCVWACVSVCLWELCLAKSASVGLLFLLCSMAELFDTDSFDTCSFEQLTSTAEWTAEHMRGMDWVTRHNLFREFIDNKPHRFLLLVVAQLGPDELLDGTLTGREPLAVVVLPWKKKRQTRLDEYFGLRVD